MVRLLPHSSSDDQRKYRSDKALKKDLDRDPIILFKKNCIDENIFSLKDAEKIEEKAMKNKQKNTTYI